MEEDESSPGIGEQARKAAAAIEGAMEGLADSMEREHVGEAVGDAMSLTRDTGRGVRDETRSQLDTPEGRRAREAVQRTRERAADAATRASTATSERWQTTKGTTREKWDDARQATRERVHDLEGRAHDARVAAEERAHEARVAAQARAAELREDLREVAQDVRVKAEAVQETTRRAKAAPGRVATEMKHAVKDAAGDYGKFAGGLGIAGLLALDALVVLTIWLVAAMSSVVGFVLGTLIAGLIIIAIAAGAFFWARSSQQHASERMNRGVTRSKEIVNDVGAPVRREFGGRGGRAV